MPEETTETSDDPDWLKQVCLSMLVGVGPYCVNVSSSRSVEQPTRASANSKPKARSALKVEPDLVLAPTPLPPSYGPLAIQPTDLPAATTAQGSASASELEVSQQIQPGFAVVVQPTVLTYSYGGLSFAWQPSQVVTFASLPAVWACITMHESSDMIQRSNPVSSAKGAFQIKSFMWAKYKLPPYPEDPNAATLSQQYRVALRIFRADGFGKWETAPLCGV